MASAVAALTSLLLDVLFQPVLAAMLPLCLCSLTLAVAPLAARTKNQKKCPPLLAQAFKEGGKARSDLLARFVRLNGDVDSVLVELQRERVLLAEVV